MSDAGRLAGRAAIVTGASSGMGRAITALFAAEGARVLAVSRGGGADGHPAITPFAADIAAPDAAGRIVAAARDAFGGIDILVNAAGLFEMAPVEQIDRGHWDRTFATNVTGPVELCLKAIPSLKASGAGRIINIGSVCVRLTNPGFAAYNASKHALTGFTLNLAIELGRHGITANMIQPGTILTPMTQPFVEDPAMLRYFEGKTAVRRLGEAGEIARAALYLADPQAGYTTGQTIQVDGGYSVGINDSGLEA
ncbi:SDR family NAD(P)-dependent oxidoreductase [Rhizorhabdus dicambivorans]|uniref:NAD(P)-dependent oxidoreductase n=1 Tax=Rhizorhabdus dicambivorans TaxID=1850238 RepID=A0A2A4FXN7_9SPHN|nr:SDR family oxidoreductase [Rhizorhabdus dicambivorans]ATE65851.1 NAD(P)-dependent oxidoreductase [Rhizorhabdus dicambivorans]PCE42965.1 NAD(P)-dependent oxidoreductase [Rhizorhabdus dicambivorans]